MHQKLSLLPFDTDEKCLTSISRLHSGLLFTPIGGRSWVISAPLLAKPPTRLVPEYLTAGAEPSTRAQLQARSRATRARLSFDAPAAFQPCSAKSLSALFRAQRRARSSLKLNKEELR